MTAGWPEETRTWLWRMRFEDSLSTRRHVTLMGSDYASALRYASDALTILSEFYDDDDDEWGKNISRERGRSLLAAPLRHQHMCPEFAV